MKSILSKTTKNDPIIYKLIRNTLTYDPKGRDDPQIKIQKFAEETGAENVHKIFRAIKFCLRSGILQNGLHR